MIDFLSGRRSSANAVVNVATVEFRFGVGFLSEQMDFKCVFPEKVARA